MKKEEILGLFNVAGKVAIITGATGGFGVMAAKMLTTMGAKVVLTGRNAAKLEQLTKEIAAEGGAAAFVAGDPCKIDDVKKVVDAALALDSFYDRAGVDEHAMLRSEFLRHRIGGPAGQRLRVFRLVAARAAGPVELLGQQDPVRLVLADRALDQRARRRDVGGLVADRVHLDEGDFHR